MTKEEPVQIIYSNNEKSLRELLKENNMLDQIKMGNKILLLEGKNLTDLDLIISSGKKIAIISIDVLGGG
jgi:hypothetical protein